MSQEDRAQEMELLDWERNNKVRATKKYSQDDPGYGPESCRQCDDPMPELRRADGRHLCTSCQTRDERSQVRKR